MIGFAREGTHYARTPDFQALLAACRACPDDRTPALVLADWLDEWDGGPGHPENAAARHAAFIRTQAAAGFAGARRKIAGASGPDAGHAQKMWFDDTLVFEPWLAGGAATAVVNSTGSGVYYRFGLPAAVKCAPMELAQHARVLALWRVPDVYVRVGPCELGVCVTTRRGREREEYSWLNAPRRQGVNRWVKAAEVPADGSHSAFVIETVLARTFAGECAGAAFHAVFRRHWRSFHPC